MNSTKKLAKTSIIALILTLTFAATFVALPVVNAEEDSYAFITVSPNPVGVGQTVSIIAWLDKMPPTASGPAGDRWEGLEVTIEKPDEKTEKLGPITSDPVGSMWASYTPTMIGTYTFQLSFPGQHIEGPGAMGGYINETYLPSTSRKVELTVQEEQLEPWPTVELPTDYWERPINAENREWYQIAGNWLGLSGGDNFGARYYNASSNFNPYSKAPNTGHIVWTKPLTFGGIIGGEFGGGGTSSYYHGHSYEPKFIPPVIMQGRLYYNIYPYGGFSTDYPSGIKCVDLRTGETIWTKDDANIRVGQIYNHISPNQYGGIAYFWDTLGSTWKMYDAFTGDYILSMENVSSLASDKFVMGPSGELLTYILDGQNNWLAMWNSSLAIPPPLPFSTWLWMWRPPLGETLDWRDGIQWNVTVPDVPGDESIKRIGSGVLLATTIGFAGSASWQMEAAFNATTGEQMWVKNQTFPTYTTLWGLQGSMMDGVYTEFIPSLTQWFGYDVKTGDKLWGPTDSLENAWGMYWTGDNIAYGRLYSLNIDGLHCYNLTTGERLWDFYSESGGLEVVYPNYPFDVGGFTIADGKVYIVTGHSHVQPLFRGAKLYCIDAETGKEIWSIAGWLQAGWVGPPTIADGYIVTQNCYDNQIYCFGKGLTETTVTVPEAVQPLGTSILIKGTVTDQSPGDTCLGVPAAGTPAVSDEYMTEWMEYLYMQKPCPTYYEGVDVKLEVLDSNGNFYEIGTVKSDGSGVFKKMWTPEVEGEYTIIATFEGSESYWSSYAETVLGVGPAPAPAEPIEPEKPAEAPFITTELAIIVAAVIVAVAVIVGFWIIRKRK